MKQDERVDDLLRELREGPVLLCGTDEAEAQRQRLMPKLRAHVLEVPRARRKERLIRRTALTLATLAAAAGVGVFTPDLVTNQTQTATVAQAEGLQLAPKASGVEFSRDGANSERVDAPVEISAKGELFVSARSALTTARGVQIELEGDTRVGLDDLAPHQDRSRLRLVGGKVHCAVPPLGSDGSFSVVTDQAEVVVHGTQFSVEVAPEAGTCVRVSEGLVEVRHREGAELLHAGGSWGCDRVEPPTSDEVSSEPQREPVAVRRARLPRVEAAKPASPPPAPPSGTLDEESQLFSKAIAAERRGDHKRARAAYSKLLQTYPDSPLAPDARRGLSRVQ